MAFNERIGLVGTDIHKFNRPRIPESGGAAILAGTLAGSFSFIWLQIFLYGGMPDLPVALASVLAILIAALIGLFDDLFALLKKVDGLTGFKRIGLPQWAKPLLTLPAAFPLMAIMAGHTSIIVPILGSVDFGILYPLLLIPLGFVGAANATNMLAGLNGLEAGLGMVLLGSMGMFALANGQLAAAALALPLAAALGGFLIWNWSPAKIMPGDSVPYIIGAAVAAVAIIGNMERFAVVCFVPWFIELLLKARGRFRVEGFGQLRPGGYLKPADGIYSLTHVVMSLGRFSERRIVALLILLELIICAAAWTIYWPL
jgi:UDP-N-acetylglucosamine--dolichyl-phosphate N-acetylglucosaminephosphotransferase